MSATPKKTAAQVAEVTGEPIEFEYLGETWSVKPTSEWRGKSLRLAEQGQIFSFLELVLVDPKQVELTDDMTLSEVEGLFAALGEASGTGNR